VTAGSPKHLRSGKPIDDETSLLNEIDHCHVVLARLKTGTDTDVNTPVKTEHQYGKLIAFERALHNHQKFRSTLG